MQKVLEEIRSKCEGSSTCSEQTITKIEKEWQEKNKKEADQSKCGRKNKFQREDEEKIVKGFKENPRLSLRNTQKDKSINPNDMGVGKIINVIKSSGLNTYMIPTIQLITEEQKEQRLHFAKVKVRWSQKWKTALFSDEIIMKKGLVGKKYVWYEQRSDISQSHCFQKEKYPTRIHIWGVISYEKPLFLQLIEGKLNSKTYSNLIKEFKVELGENYFKDRLFQQVLASCHSSKYTSNYLKDNNINELGWIPKGAELSQIERIWAYFKSEMNEIEDNLDIKQLFERIQHIFLTNNKINLAIKRLYEYLPSKISQVIQKIGDQIMF